MKSLLVLNTEMVAQVLGISATGTYELMHQADFPTLRIGSRMVVPKEKFVAQVERSTGGASE